MTGLFFLCGLALAKDTYKIDKHHSSVVFHTLHQSISYTYGRFNQINGRLVIDADKIENSKINISIPTESIDTNNFMRDTHLKSKDFLAVQKYPTIEFNSHKITQVGDILTVVGQLKLRGVTKEISIEMSKTGEGKDMWGGYRIGYISHFSIQRSEFGINHMSKSIGDEVFLTISLEGMKQ